MPQPRATAIDWTVVAGASLYWASVIVQYLLPAGGPSSLELLATRYAVLTALVGSGFLVQRTLLSLQGRRVLLGLAAIASVILLLPQAIGSLPPALDMGLRMYAIAVPMVVWAFAFASMDKRRAGQNVAATMLASACAVLLLVGALEIAPHLTGLPHALTALSALIAGSGHVRFLNQRRAPVEGTRCVLISFVLSRCACGACIGLCLAAPFAPTTADVSPALVAIGVAALAIASWMYVRSLDTLYAALPALLFLSVGAVFLPFFGGSITVGAGTCTALAWFAWAAFSAFQLSDLKERCGMAEITLCLVEKAVLSMAILGGCAAFYLAKACIPSKLLETGAPFVLFGSTLLLILAISYAMARLVSARKEDEMHDRLAQTRAERLQAVFDQLATEFGLSGREQEVLTMLADGYTRTYIRETLGISDGTAKAHIAHVYAKLDVHRKDDLLDLIDQRMGGV